MIDLEVTLFYIPLSGFRVCNLYNRAEVRPSQIVNTRVHNLQIIETQIKLAKVIQIAFAECATVFRHQLFCGSLKMRRVPQEAFLSTARIFRTVEACFWYRVLSLRQVAAAAEPGKMYRVNVTLKSICYVVKVTAKVPSGYDHLTRIELNTTNGTSTPMGLNGWTRLNDEFGIRYGNPWSYYAVGLGTTFRSAGSSLGTGVSPDGSGNVVAYIIGYTGAPRVLPSGTVLAIEAGYGSVSDKFNATKTLATDISLEPGKMYRVNVTLN